MMGPTQRNEPKLFHYGVNLEKRVRANNPLRRIAELVDFNFVRQRVEPFYGHDGHESEDPIVIMKLMLLLFLDDVSSERELMRIVGERIDYLWFLRMDLDDEIPDHSVLSKARRRWGQEAFEELFVMVVGACVEAGLVDGKKIHMDGSLVNANASWESVKKGSPELIEALRRTYRREESKLDETDSDDGAMVRVDSTPPHTTVSKTDPDAVVMRKGGRDIARPRYRNHRAVDDQCGVITAIETTPADVNENEKLISLVEQHESHTGQRVGTVVADAQYGTNDNFAACEKRGISSHMADLKSTYTNHVSRGIFREEDFHYDAATDSYICPAGQRLKRSPKLDGHFQVYRGNKTICGSCALQTQCTRSRHWRTVKRHIDHERIQRARAQSHSGWARRDRRRRKHLMEGSFADAVSNHGFKRARWRRLHNQQIQDLLIATCQNIRILMRYECRREAASMVVAFANSSTVSAIRSTQRVFPYRLQDAACILSR
jgi:transposase